MGCRNVAGLGWAGFCWKRGRGKESKRRNKTQYTHTPLAHVRIHAQKQLAHAVLGGGTEKRTQLGLFLEAIQHEQSRTDRSRSSRGRGSGCVDVGVSFVCVSEIAWLHSVAESDDKWQARRPVEGDSTGSTEAASEIDCFFFCFRIKSGRERNRSGRRRMDPESWSGLDAGKKDEAGEGREGEKQPQRQSRSKEACVVRIGSSELQIHAQRRYEPKTSVIPIDSPSTCAHTHSVQ